MQKKSDQLEEDTKKTSKVQSLTASNLAKMEYMGPSKLSKANLDPIIEEGGLKSDQIYMDKDDPKKKKYDDLKRKALLVT